jgi:hypothetical protein
VYGARIPAQPAGENTGVEINPLEDPAFIEWKKLQGHE